MKILKPKGLITAQFRAGIGEFYAHETLLGHTGIDITRYYGANIPGLSSGIAYKVIHEHELNPMLMKSVYILSDGEDGFYYEVGYCHFSQITLDQGDYVCKGELIGYEGNTGVCYAGNKLVTLEEKLAGSKLGSHLHLYLRRCKRVSQRQQGKNYLTDVIGNDYYDGYYYEIVENMIPVKIKQQDGTIIDKLVSDNGLVNPEDYDYEPSIFEWLRILTDIVDNIRRKIQQRSS